MTVESETTAAQRARQQRLEARRQLTVRCEHCDAPLSVPETATSATCKYCRAESRVRPARRTTATGTPHPARERKVGAASGRSRRIYLAVGLLIVLATAAIYTIRRPSSASEPRKSLPLRWDRSGAACLIGTKPQLFAVAANASAARAATLDGATGRVTWLGPSKPPGAKAFCVGNEVAGVAHADNTVTLHVASQLNKPITLKLPSAPHAVGVGTGCVVITDAERARRAFGLDGSKISECHAETRRIGAARPGVIDHSGRATEVSVGQRHYVLTKSDAPPHMLTLRAVEKDAVVWERALAYAAPSFSTVVAATERAVYVVGALPASTDRGILIAFDQANGTEAFQHTLAGPIANRPTFLGFDGASLLLVHSTGVTAFDPVSGTIRWTVDELTPRPSAEK